MKKLAAAVLAAGLTLAMAANAMAATTDWRWIDTDSDSVMECYAYDENGNLYTNTTTPDNYTVNEAGAWTVDGKVQQKSVFGAQGTGWKQSSNPEHLGQWWYATNNEMTQWHAGSEAGPKWVWIGSYCYAFDPAGWMFQSATTPDNYTVDDQGRWTVNGAVQVASSTSKPSSSSGGSGSSGSGNTPSSYNLSYVDAVELNNSTRKAAAESAAESAVPGISVSLGDITPTADATEVVNCTITADVSSIASDSASKVVTAVTTAINSAGVITNSVKSISVNGFTLGSSYDAAVAAAKAKASGKVISSLASSYTFDVTYSDGSEASITIDLTK